MVNTKSRVQGMVTFNIRHTTTYSYDQEVYESRNLIKLYPLEDEYQKTISHNLWITGNPEVLANKDAFGNTFGIFTLWDYHRELKIDSESVIAVFPRNIDAEVRKTRQNWADIDLLSMDNSFHLFLNHKSCSSLPEMCSLVHSFQPRSRHPFDMILLFNEYVFNHFTYSPFSTTISTPMEQVWNTRTGVCQDFALILIEMLRLVNIPARYVSGYICPNKDGMRGDGASHAWVEAYLPNYGWVGADPTNNCLVSDKHVRLAVGRDYHDVSPVKGEFKGLAYQNLLVTVTVSYQTDHETAPIH